MTKSASSYSYYLSFLICPLVFWNILYLLPLWCYCTVWELYVCMVVSDCLLDTCMKRKKVILTTTQISKNATSQHNTHLHSYCPPLSFSRNTVMFYSIKLESHSFLFFICSSQLMPILTPKVYFHAPCPPSTIQLPPGYAEKQHVIFFPQKLLLF